MNCFGNGKYFGLGTGPKYKSRKRVDRGSGFQPAQYRYTYGRKKNPCKTAGKALLWEIVHF